MTAKAALRPENEAPRKTWQGPRGTTNYINNDAIDNNLELLRVQRLIALSGVSPVYAAVIAPLAFGVAA